MSYTESDLQKMLASGNVRVAKDLPSRKPERVATHTTILPAKETALKKLKIGKQTKTKMEYGRKLAFEFPAAKIIPWGLTLRMSNGHKYTPDLAVLLPDKILLVEVKARGKNGFRQPSFGRAKLAYDQCRIEYPYFDYRFAEKYKGVWNI